MKFQINSKQTWYGIFCYTKNDDLLANHRHYYTKLVDAKRQARAIIGEFNDVDYAEIWKQDKNGNYGLSGKYTFKVKRGTIYVKI